jgi:hypothetical protein
MLYLQVVERILFLYAKLNPGQGYVQARVDHSPFSSMQAFYQLTNPVCFIVKYEKMPGLCQFSAPIYRA